MIPLYILVAIFFACAVWCIVSLKKKIKYDKYVYIATAVCLVICLFIGLINLSTPAMDNDHYRHLILYKEAVENSDDELLRFDYYQRVNAWNEFYANWYRLDNSPWVGCLIPDYVYDNDVGLIDFELHRG